MKRAVALVGDDPVIFEHLGDIYASSKAVGCPRAGSIPWNWIHRIQSELNASVTSV
jgi:hypothetical protein